MKRIQRTVILSLFAPGMCLLLSGCGQTDQGTAPTPMQAAAARVEETMVAKTAREIATENSARVLRHAVFFQFKDSASDADIRGIVDTLAALPDKIPEIIDFKWGTNNSTQDLDDGFTHCFLLTFADEAGRKAYLPHKSHEAFGDLLQPHLGKVFVIDYWGKQGSPSTNKELKHGVFFKFKDNAMPEAITKVEQAFAALPSKIEAIKGFEWGRNNSPENHDAGFTHVFMVTFDSEAGRAAYLAHPEQQAFIEVLEPVLDKARVLDFEYQME